MTDWTLALRLGALGIIAAAIGMPAQFRSAVRHSLPGYRTAGPVLPTVFLGAIATFAALIGSALAPRVGLRAPLLGARLAGLHFSLLAASVGSGVLGGVAGAAALPVYYAVFPRVHPGVFQLAERLRTGMGLPARVALGGVLEELVFRWGALAAIAWACMHLNLGGSSVRSFSVAGSALFFGAVHLPGARGLAGRLHPATTLTILVVNGWLGVIAGWLAWQRGLASAMVAHGTVHVIWAMAERRVDDGPADPDTT